MFNLTLNGKVSLTQLSGVTSTVIGAMSIEQLNEGVDAYELVLFEEILNDVAQVIKRFPVPF